MKESDRQSSQKTLECLPSQIFFFFWKSQIKFHTFNFSFRFTIFLLVLNYYSKCHASRVNIPLFFCNLDMNLLPILSKLSLEVEQVANIDLNIDAETKFSIVFYSTLHPQLITMLHHRAKGSQNLPNHEPEKFSRHTKERKLLNHLMQAQPFYSLID